jgi:hypothetical protein
MLSAIPFGFDTTAVTTYLRQPEFTGPFLNGISTAYNLNYLLLGSRSLEPPFWLTLSGMLIVLIVMASVVYFNSRRNRTLEEYSLGAGLLALACFSFLIKMKERYLVFCLPFFGLAAWQDRRLVKPFLWLSWLQLFYLVISLFQYNRKPEYRLLTDSFYLWSLILGQGWLLYLFAVLTLGLFGYLSWLYYNRLRKLEV